MRFNRDWPGTHRLEDYDNLRELSQELKATVNSYRQLRPYCTDMGMKLTVALSRQALNPTLLQLPLFFMKLDDFLRQLTREDFTGKDDELCQELELLKERLAGELAQLSLECYQALESFLSLAVAHFSSPPAQAYKLAQALEELVLEPSHEGYSEALRQAHRLKVRVEKTNPSSTVLELLDERLLALEVKLLLHS